MLNLRKIIAAQFIAPLISLSLLMSCEIFAYEMLSPQQFANHIDQLDKLIKSDADQATFELDKLKQNIRRYSPSQQIAFYSLQSEFLLDYGEVHRAHNNAQWGLDIAQANNIIDNHVVELTYSLGFAFESLGDLKQAEIKYQEGLEAAQSLNDKGLVTKGLVNLGAIFYLTERFERSLIVLTEALATAEQENSHELKGLVASEFGILYAYLNEDGKAKRFYQQCYESFKLAKDYPQSLNCLVNMGLNELNSLNYQPAFELLLRAEQELARVKSSNMAHSIYLNLAIALLKKEPSDPEGALRYLTIAEQYLVDIEQYEAQMSFYTSKAYVLEGLERYPDALVALENAESVVPKDTTFKSRYARMNIHFIRAKIYRGMKDFQQALKAQSHYASALRAIERDEKIASIQELRVKFESERADIEREILQANQEIQSQLLIEQNREKTAQFYGFIAIAFIILLFAWWLTRLISAQKRLVKLARIDEPTAIYNRQYLGWVADKMFEAAKSDIKPMSLVYISIEKLMEINQQWGYQYADSVVHDLASAIASAMPEKDVYGRLSNNEFVCLTEHSEASYLEELITNVNLAINAIKKSKVQSKPQATENETVDSSNIIEIPLEVTIGASTFDKASTDKISHLLKSAELTAAKYQHTFIITKDDQRFGGKY